eukprot:818187-Rhodomonas_salina.1
MRGAWPSQSVRSPLCLRAPYTQTPLPTYALPTQTPLPTYALPTQTPVLTYRMHTAHSMWGSRPIAALCDAMRCPVLR